MGIYKSEEGTFRNGPSSVKVSLIYEIKLENLFFTTTHNSCIGILVVQSFLGRLIFTSEVKAI